MKTVGDIKLMGWDEGQVKKAVSSLLVLSKKKGTGKKKALLDEDKTIFLQISLKNMPVGALKLKPIGLPIPHPIYSPEENDICVIVKDHEGEGHKEAKAKLRALDNMGGVKKVVGVSKLRTKYESHEAKRQLCNSYDLFIADDRIIRMLPKLIGKSFFHKKKQPIPIDFGTKDFPKVVRDVCSKTYFVHNKGTTINIKIAPNSFKEEDISENLHAALAEAVEHIPHKWSNIQAVFIKTADSVALPLFQRLPEASKKI
mmetsp:Transcript_29441/g.54032  ORF Transcript_29441/g.54032 Transcript_29441/m.54032 type:complete len:257 (-) Transcript_29441:40-810(-)|eukprot:CAMPEP_0175061386 /NCGR_PEP_ID=MMETSP0052_2-20121109/13552_1 /TAXON_ID=51329 ORGANISM="Polytomella parva, Strain SAG 63-3" /NCGR_SAMPLE_ID=MMETSP0052_2 /ASSEMBLY_ACC=CAM_ASM_000194 /LENGTH=256 /DNA_ID=CAMNT_0016327227 /DNA_START=26 /DNA_END=796 /DNA_ORIENTATION=+